MVTNAELQQKVRQLEELLARHGIRQEPTVEDLTVEERPDYIEHGGERHAAFLGLEQVDDDEAEEMDLVAEGTNGQRWTLEDRTVLGLAADDEFLLAFLRQRVNELRGPPEPQSFDRSEPNYKQPMWVPDEVPVTGQV